MSPVPTAKTTAFSIEIYSFATAQFRTDDVSTISSRESQALVRNNSVPLEHAADVAVMPVEVLDLL